MLAQAAFGISRLEDAAGPAPAEHEGPGKEGHLPAHPQAGNYSSGERRTRISPKPVREASFLIIDS